MPCYQKFRPNLEASPELSYLAGVMLGDGSCARRERKGDYIIQLGCKDYEFALAFNKCVCTLLKKTRLYSINPDRIYWHVSAYSKALYFFFKGKRVKDFEALAEAYPVDFLRGLYDSEGGVTGTWKQRKCKVVAITNLDRDLLAFAQHLLLKLGIPCYLWKATYKNKRGIFVGYKYILGVSKRENAIRFCQIIGSCIRRKIELERPAC